MKPGWIATACLVLILFIGAGCNKLTMDNYSKIKSGMSYNEVVAILGTPGKCDDVLGMRSCVWGDKNKSITVAFVADKVLLFSANNIH